MSRYYLDHNASTPLDSEVRDELLYTLDRATGNPSSLHSEGTTSRKILETARQRVANLIGAQPEEIIFTSGGTEANALALQGVRTDDSYLTSEIEHPSVLNAFKNVEAQNKNVVYVKADSQGLIKNFDFSDPLGVVSLMLVNNEVGTIQNVLALGRKAKKLGALVHSDAVQALGKVDIDVKKLEVDLLSLSAHKIYGPKGVGALYVRQGVKLNPLWQGGKQEQSLRPGTENLASIAAFGKACEVMQRRMKQDNNALQIIRDQFENELLKKFPQVIIYGKQAPRVANTTCFSFVGKDASELAKKLDLYGASVSTGSACTSKKRAPSHVLTAMGVSENEARGMLRVSFGRGQGQEALEGLLAQMVKLPLN